MAADCKSVSVNSRWFESNLFHNPALSQSLTLIFPRAAFLIFYNPLAIQKTLKKMWANFVFIKLIL